MDHVALVTVFATYNSAVESRPIELVTVGNISYNKVERSMAILNVFLNFVQVYLVILSLKLQLLKRVFSI